MTEQNKIYKCMKCSNLIEKLANIGNVLICCEQEMQEQKAKEQDTKLEKHVPFIEEFEPGKVIIRVGENEKHPMTKEHYIQFIEIILDNGKKVLRHNLNPGDEPVARFPVKLECIIEVREFCNLHGLWVNKLK